jgi:hypothetical protein
MKRLFLGITVGFIVLVIAAVVATTFYLDSLAKKGVERVGSDVAKVEVRVANASLGVLSGKGELRGLRVANPEGFQAPSAVAAESVTVEVQPRSLLTGKVVIHSIQIRSPEITFEGGLQGNNLGKLLENIRGTDPAQDQASQRKLQVDDLLVSGGQVNLTLTLLGSRSATVPMPDIHLTQLGQGPDGITSAELSEKLLAVLLETAIRTATAELAKAAIPSLDKAPKSIGDLFRQK